MSMLQYRPKHDFCPFHLMFLCVTIKPHIVTHTTKVTMGYQELVYDSDQTYRSFEICIILSLRCKQWIHLISVGLPNN
jgi:hypothetical protein